MIYIALFFLPRRFHCYILLTILDGKQLLSDPNATYLNQKKPQEQNFCRLVLRHPSGIR